MVPVNGFLCKPKTDSDIKFPNVDVGGTNFGRRLTIIDNGNVYKMTRDGQWCFIVPAAAMNSTTTNTAIPRATIYSNPRPPLIVMRKIIEHQNAVLFCFAGRVAVVGVLLDTNLLRSGVAMALMTAPMRMRSEWTWLLFVLVWFLDATKPLQKTQIPNFLPLWEPCTRTNLHTTHSQNTSTNGTYVRR